jgi:Ser/Thr protein kinase RdoA (MazF antagonist)
MNDFYHLTPAEQSVRFEGLAITALQHWNVQVSGLTLLKLRENAVFQVSATDGARYVVRVHRAGYHTDAELQSEMWWMAALNEAGVRTPAFLPASDGSPFKTVSVPEVPEPRQVDLSEWIDGHTLGTIEGGLSDAVTDAAAVHRLIGETMGRVHNQAVSWHLPSGFTRHAWDAEGLVGDRPFWGRFWELARLSDEQRRATLEARAKLQGVLARFGRERDRYSLIHADFLPENLLVAREGARLIDFDDCGFGWHMFDVATAVFFQAGQSGFDSSFEALVDGYRSVRPLPDEHLALLPAFMAARATTYLGWIHTRWETETARQLSTILTDPLVELLAQYVCQPSV